MGFRPFDDTFITLRVARNLLAGAGPVYSEGERVLATTTPLWAFLTAALGTIGIPLETAAFTLSLVADAGVALLLWSLMRRLGLGDIAAVLSVVWFVFFIDALSLARSGMEVAVFACAVLGAIRLALANRMVLAWSVAAAAPLIRPEGVLVFPALVMLAMTSRGRLRTPWQAPAIAGVIGGVWVAWAWWYFGSPIPQSLVAKASHVTADADLCGFSATNLRLLMTTGQYGDVLFSRSWLQMVWLPWGLAVAGLVSLRREPSAMAALAVVPIAYVVLYGSRCAFTWFPWYYYLLYPFVCALAAVGTLAIVRLSARWIPSADRWMPGAVLVVWAVAQTVALAAYKWAPTPDRVVEGYRQVVVSIPRTTDVLVAASEIGVIGWDVWPARMFDLVGLATREAVGVPPAESIARVRPDYIVARTDEAASWLADLAATDWFARDYALVATSDHPGASRQFRVWQRRDPTRTDTPHPEP